MEVIVDAPNPFPLFWAENASPSDVTDPIPTDSQINITPGAASLNDGFPPLTFISPDAGGVPPFGQDFNGILQWITQWIQYLTAGSVWLVYDADFAGDIGGYPFGTILLPDSQPAGFYYYNLVDNNSSDPNTGGANWQLFSLLPINQTTPTTQIFTSGSGNYNPTSDQVKYIRVKMVAGGGAGFSGNSGGNSQFGAWTTVGGSPGPSAGGIGGVGGTGGINGSGNLIVRTPGGQGGTGFVPISGSNSEQGHGGSSFFGGGGAGANSSSGAAAGSVPGSGGGGKFQSGPGGGAGEYVEFFTNPQTWAYSVGPGGTQTGGGAGASGQIIVEEYYHF